MPFPVTLKTRGSNNAHPVKREKSKCSPRKAVANQDGSGSSLWGFHLASLHKPQFWFAMQQLSKIVWTCTDQIPGQYLCFTLCRSVEVIPHLPPDIFLIDSSFEFGSFPGVRLSILSFPWCSWVKIIGSQKPPKKTQCSFKTPLRDQCVVKP